MSTATLTRDLPNRSRIVATITTERGYFSLTGELYEAHGTWSGAARQRHGRDIDAGGQIVDELRAAFGSRIEPFARLHLSDVETGEPMHAVENGRYFLRLGDVETCARHLRVDVSELPEQGASDEAFAAWVDTLRPRWAAEAAAGRALLDAMRTIAAVQGEPGTAEQRDLARRLIRTARAIGEPCGGRQCWLDLRDDHPELTERDARAIIDSVLADEA